MRDRLGHQTGYGPNPPWLFGEYCFRLPRDPVGGEYYITDVPRMLREQGDVVEIVDEVPPEDVLSINTFEQLADVDEVMRGRLQKAGATS